ncbi:MAG: thiol-disulfide oxidoreductase DCC family protein [Myxococcaceae bacterium]|nr:thiol-disulfide oxidoreductase DCC family protein [Myxococcaceae bacterium]MCI0673205.1 thiol-disulfide oxidoreductase DCC family protein [Myxococcaceae bacterium]
MTATTTGTEPVGSVVLFDGVCNLCNGAVNFIIDRDPEAHFHFASLQSPAGTALMEGHGLKVQEEPESIVLLEAGQLFVRSTAALRIARHLRGAWRLLYLLVLVPRPLRDAAYRFIARHRYRWFGRTEACRVPTPELKARFL